MTLFLVWRLYMHTQRLRVDTRDQNIYIFLLIGRTRRPFDTTFRDSVDGVVGAKAHQLVSAVLSTLR